MSDPFGDWSKALRHAQDRIAALSGALEDAIELAEEGWGYAGEYFNDKWDSAGRIDTLKGVLLEGKAPEETQSVQAEGAP